MDRRLCCVLLAALITAFMGGCGADDYGRYDVASVSDEASLACSDVYNGYYSNGEFVIELIRTSDAKEEAAYNLTVFSRENGDQKFFGTAEGCVDEGICASGMDGEKELHISADEFGELTVTYISNGSKVLGMCGSYGYLGASWTAQTDDIIPVIREGEYRNGEFKLSVRTSRSAVRFVITDADGAIVCEGSKQTDTDVSSLGVEYEGARLELAAILSEGKICMEVVSYGEGDDCGYSGKYIAFE